MSEYYSTKCAKWSGFIRICVMECKIQQGICILCSDDKEQEDTMEYIIFGIAFVGILTILYLGVKTAIEFSEK